jgi:large subunit ribosomal protein L9
MEVILNQDVDKIGKAGSVVKVKDGFARNFLIPNGLALPLTPGNLKKLEQQKQNKTQQLEKLKQAALELKGRLDSFSLTIPALTQEEDKLYGSVSSQDLEQALSDEGFSIDKNSLVVEQPIKSLGIYEIPVKLHPEVTATLKVWIVKK